MMDNNVLDCFETATRFLASHWPLMPMLQSMFALLLFWHNHDFMALEDAINHLLGKGFHTAEENSSYPTPEKSRLYYGKIKYHPLNYREK